MNRIQFIESLLEEIDELNTVDQVKTILQEKLDEASEEHEVRMMQSETSLFDEAVDEDDLY